MFHDLKDRFVNLIFSRVFVLIILMGILCGTLINRIFDLQIVHGAEYMENFKLRIKKERSIPCTRGNIYDRNGELLAYNELAYNVTIEDVYESGKDKNERLNSTIRKLIGLIEENGDKVVSDFSIILDKRGQFQFSVENSQKNRFIADVYGVDTTDKIVKTATADDIMDYLAGPKRYEIGAYKDPDDSKSFVVGDGYTKEELLKMVTIRYAMSLNSYQKYIATTVANDVNEKTVAVVMENSDSLDGVSIAEDTVRKYVDSVYFSHILGYIGKISQDELDELKKENDNYTATDIVGKSGIEQTMELSLQGVKGREEMYVDNMGKVIEIIDRTEPKAGADLYLTIDRDLQKAVYNILERKIAGILVSKIDNVKGYSGNDNSSGIRIPIYEVYFALINNNVIDISNFSKHLASTVEKEVYGKFDAREEEIFAKLNDELFEANTPYKDISEEYQSYESYIVTMLTSDNMQILDENKAEEGDEAYKAWHTDKSISLADYLNHAIAMNWIDVTKLGLGEKYASSEEIYEQLVNVIFEGLGDNTEFAKRIYRYMIGDGSLTGDEICHILLEQGKIQVSSQKEQAFLSGRIAAYAFMIQMIEDLDITPAQLALDPCSGSCVLTNTDTGEVLALVTYPGYDTNKLTNVIDAEYFNQLQNDLSKPMWNYATQQRSAPGSTFKMVSSVAGMEEGIIGINEKILCSGPFDKISPAPRCWIVSQGGAHGMLDVTGAIQNSCNSFFYEVGYRLGSVGSIYNSDIGIDKLNKYADMFGLSEKSGIEIAESDPQLTDTDSVRSAIGQATYNFTTIGLSRYVTAVANNGTCFELSLLDKLVDNNGNIIQDFTPSVRNRIDLPDYEWDVLHKGMRRVVESKAYFDDMEVNVAGKTGTAQENRNRASHALFVGYAPYENPEVSIATRIAFGYTSEYAAEISRDVLRYYFNPEKETDLLERGALRPEAVATGGD